MKRIQVVIEVADGQVITVQSPDPAVEVVILDYDILDGGNFTLDGMECNRSIFDVEYMNSNTASCIADRSVTVV